MICVKGQRRDVALESAVAEERCLGKLKRDEEK
jgi:hypothetical protein